MTRTREDVWKLTRKSGDWPEPLVAYERAVVLLRNRDTSAGPPVDPLGWRFLAAMHGLASPAGTPDTSNSLWCNCQHGSWYFLPWHRMYLHAFEMIVQDVIDDKTWSLPYWYAIDPDDPATSVLPPAFRDATNSLYTDKRSISANSGLPLPNLSKSIIDALEADIFSTPEGTSTFGGGERSTPSFNGNELGLLEGVPHGAVHSLVGNDYDAEGNPTRLGWMGSFYTAGLDPVFWLHHANIDRLWQVWLNQNPSHVNPTHDPAWFDTEFSFPRVDGGLNTWKVGEVLDTESLGYNYDNTDAPAAVAPPAVPAGAGGPDIGLEDVRMPEPQPPQVIGASLDVPLATAESVDIPLAQPVDLELAADVEGAAVVGSRVFLRIEGVTGTAAAPVYEIYLNVPDGDRAAEHPELRAGLLSTFGLIEASQTNELHDGSGLTAVFDITGVRDVLEQQERWDPRHLKVSFSPVPPIATAQAGEELEEALADTLPADLRASQVVVVAS